MPRTVSPLLGVALALLIGSGVPLQTRINGELGDHLGDPILAALISMWGGLVLLGVLAVALPGVRRGLSEIPQAVRNGAIRPGYLLGGTVGALFIIAQTVTVAVLGVTVFIVAVVAGQTIGGLGTDAIGFAGHRRRRPTARRLIGAGLILLAVLLPALVDSEGLTAGRMLIALGVVVVGVLTGFQHAANARVGAAVRSPLAATVVNFLLGTFIVTVVAAVRLVANGPPAEAPSQWWLYLGGIAGIVFIGGSAALIPHVGVLVIGLGSITGQLAVSLLLDYFTPLGTDGVSPMMVGGTVLALIAVVVTTLPGRRRASHLP